MELEQASRDRQLRDEEELSYREIAAALDAEGLRPKRGNRWSGNCTPDARQPHRPAADVA